MNEYFIVAAAFTAAIAIADSARTKTAGDAVFVILISVICGAFWMVVVAYAIYKTSQAADKYLKEGSS